MSRFSFLFSLCSFFIRVYLASCLQLTFLIDLNTIRNREQEKQKAQRERLALTTIKAQHKMQQIK
jgi:hypothetical protein